MKKLIVWSLVLLMVASFLTACSLNPKQKTDEEKNNTATNDGTVAQPKGYPSKNIEFVVPAAAGAMLDILVRGLDKSGFDLGKPLAISNMPGASQTLGLAEVVSRKADGYTISCAGAAGSLIQPLLMDLSYKFEDFRYISMLNAPIPNAVAVSAKSGYKSWDDIVAKLKAGKKVHYTSANIGSVGHLAALKLINQLGAPSANYVSYNGSAEATTALLSGDVDFFVFDVDAIMQREEEGQFKCLLTLDEKRSDYAPDVPAASEVGIKGMENFMGMTWVVMDAETPDEIVKWVKQQLDKAVGSKEFADFLKTINKEPTPVVSEEELTTMLRDAKDAYRKVIDQLSE